MTQVRYLSKREVRTVSCPVCFVLAGEPCRQDDGSVRQGNHSRRVNSAADALGIRLPHHRQRIKREQEERERHPCAGCGTSIRLRFRFCRHCAGLDRPNVDAMTRRLPGSFEGGKKP